MGDALLLQGQVNGTADTGALPASMEELAASLESPAYKYHPLRERLDHNIRRSQKWEALRSAWTQGDLPRLRAALKTAKCDQELCSMPIVTKSQAALTELLQITRDCDIALQALYDKRGNPQSHRARLLKSIGEAQQLSLGPMLWEDPILAEALDELDKDNGK